MSRLLTFIRELWRSEAFWFGFRETLSLRIIIDPKGHQRDFRAVVQRRAAQIAGRRALAQDTRETGE